MSNPLLDYLPQFGSAAAGDSGLSDADAIFSALIDTEASGPGAVSGKGAQGRAQIMPGTFKQYAVKGEAYDNEADRIRAARRKVDDDYQWAASLTDDPEQIKKLTAAAYFSGRGGAALWARGDGNKRNDGNLDINQYVDRFTSKIGKQVNAAIGQPQDAGQQTGDDLLAGKSRATDPQQGVFDSVFEPKQAPAAKPAPEQVANPDLPDLSEWQNRNIQPSQASDYGTLAQPEQLNTTGVNWSKKLSASIDSYQANLWSIPAALGSEYALKAMQENKAAAEQGFRDAGGPQSWDEMEFGKNFGQYFGHLFVQSAPYLAEFAATGFGLGSVLKKGLATTAERIATKAATEAVTKGATAAQAAKLGNAAADGFFGTIGGVIGSYPSSTGDVLSNQYEQAGKFNLPAAAALGIPYAALNAAGVEGMMMRGLARGLPEISAKVAGKGIAGAAGRAAITGAETGLFEGSTETGQEVMNQLGRMSVDPNATLTSGDAPQRYKESFIAGSLMGGAMGAAAGPFRKPNSPLTNAANAVAPAPAGSPPVQAGGPGAAQLPPGTPPGAPPAGSPGAGAESSAAGWGGYSQIVPFDDPRIPPEQAADLNAKQQAVGAFLSDFTNEQRLEAAGIPIDQARYVWQNVINNPDAQLQMRVDALRKAADAVQALRPAAPLTPRAAVPFEKQEAPSRLSLAPKEQQQQPGIEFRRPRPAVNPDLAIQGNGSFAQMDDLAVLIQQERADVDAARADRFSGIRARFAAGWVLGKGLTITNPDTAEKLAVSPAEKAHFKKLQKDAANGSATAPAATNAAPSAPGDQARPDVLPGSPAVAPVGGNVQPAPGGNPAAQVSAPGSGAVAPDGVAAGGRSAVALAAARPWDQENRNRRGDEWFEGARVNESARAGFTDALANGGANLQAHGMGKERTLGGGIQNLLNMLSSGLDPNRGGGILQTAPLVSRPGEGLVGATASGSAYSDGPFMLVARPGEALTGNLSGLGAILINQAHADIAPQIADAIRAIRPDIIVAPYSEAGSVARQLNSQDTKASPASAPLSDADLEAKRKPAATNASEGDIGRMFDEAVDGVFGAKPAPSERDAAMAELGQGIDELISLLGGKTNMMPEEEARLIPIMSKIFRAAAKLGYLTFKDAGRFVLNEIRGKSREVADKLSIDNLQAGYVNIASSIGGDKRAALDFDSIEQLMADEPKHSAEIDAAAHEAATSHLNDKPQPTEGQKEAGNYAKGHVTIQGLDISIENPRGSTRSGTAPDGTKWETKLAHHYGYIRGTVGADKDHVDIFLTPGAETAPMAWVIDQKNKDGSYDEHKIVLGPQTESEARAAYLANYAPGWDGIGAISSLPMPAFRAWVKSSSAKKPLSYAQGKAQTPENGLFAKTDLEKNFERIKAGVVRFASGMSAVGDLVKGTYARSGHTHHGIGVDIGQLSKNGIDALSHAVLSWNTPIFIDSGAFSTFRGNLNGKNLSLNFDDIMRKYDEILSVIDDNNAVESTDHPRPMLVMPDVVGDQHASIELARNYADDIRSYAQTNVAQPIVPIQKGSLTLAEAYRTIVEIVGTDNFIVGLPSNAKAITSDELAAFLADVKPARIHFLGAAADSKLDPLLRIVANASPDSKVSADASQIRSKILNGVKSGLTREEAINQALRSDTDPGVARYLEQDINPGDRIEWDVNGSTATGTVISRMKDTEGFAPSYEVEVESHPTQGKYSRAAAPVASARAIVGASEKVASEGGKSVATLLKDADFPISPEDARADEMAVEAAEAVERKNQAEAKSEKDLYGPRKVGTRAVTYNNIRINLEYTARAPEGTRETEYWIGDEATGARSAQYTLHDGWKTPSEIVAMLQETKDPDAQWWSELIISGVLNPTRSEKVVEGETAIVNQQVDNADATKEPWQMTAGEFSAAAKSGKLVKATGQQSRREIEYEAEHSGNETPLGYGEAAGYSPNDIAHFYANYPGLNAESGRRMLVKHALREGKPVPAEVLADYPDLKGGLPPEEPEAAADPAELDGNEGWTRTGYIEGNDGISYGVDFRDIKQDGTAYRQIRIQDENTASHMAVWEWRSSKLNIEALDNLRIDLAVFHYVSSHATDEAFGPDATDGDALWNKYGPEILDQIRDAIPSVKTSEKPIQESMPQLAAPANESPYGVAVQQSRSNVVIRDVRDRDGNKLGDIIEPYDGTEEGARAAASRATDRMWSEYEDASNIQSRIGATDANGDPKWAISPNLANINPVDTAEGLATFGDEDAIKEVYGATKNSEQLPATHEVESSIPAPSEPGDVGGVAPAQGGKAAEHWLHDEIVNLIHFKGRTKNRKALDKIVELLKRRAAGEDIRNVKVKSYLSGFTKEPAITEILNRVVTRLEAEDKAAASAKRKKGFAEEAAKAAKEHAASMRVGDLVRPRDGRESALREKIGDEPAAIESIDLSSGGDVWVSLAGFDRRVPGVNLEIVQTREQQDAQIAQAQAAEAEAPTPAAEPVGKLSEGDLESAFNEAAAELQESTQEQPEAPAPGAPVAAMADTWTEDDIAFLRKKVEDGQIVLLASNELGLPTIHDMPSDKVHHMGFGVFRTSTTYWEGNWTAGGAMSHTPGGHAYTTVSMTRGEIDPAIFDRDAVLNLLQKREANQQKAANLLSGRGGRLETDAERVAREGRGGRKFPSRDEILGGVPDGWTEAVPGGMATSRDPVSGGIIDTVMGSDPVEWFVIPQNDAIAKIEGLGSRAEAFAALDAAVNALGRPASTLDEQTNKTAASLAADAAKLGVKGIDEAMKGLVKLFGGGPGKLQSFPAGMDEDAYKQAKPHFEAALKAFQEAGKTIKDLFKFLIEKFGMGIKPYALRFAKEMQLSADLGQKASANRTIANYVLDKLSTGADIRWQDLFDVADKAFGGTQADGTYTVKDAYDAMEMGVNLYLEKGNWTAAGKTAEDAQRDIRNLGRMIAQLPTQTKRTQEMDEFQQFSTPPTLAYASNWVANIRPGEVMLEPSAGTGDLAVFAHNAGANLILNELSGRRAAILKELFPRARVFTENAEQLNNVLPADALPTVVVMNPPFSSTAGRKQGSRDTMNGARHIEQALKRLDKGGRLVAIVGEGMAADRPAFKEWWKKIAAEYNVRANIGISGKEYAKYGTTFDNQILVIDKNGPTINTVVTGKVESVAELPALLEGIRNDRPQAVATIHGPESVADQSEGDGNAAEAGPADGAAVGTGSNQPDAVGTGKRPSSARPGRPGIPASPATPGTGNATADNDGQRGPGRPDSAGGTDGSGVAAAGATDGVAPSATGVTLGTAEKQKQGDLTDSVFENYRPQRLEIKGVHEHPGKLVQSAAMAAVEPPEPIYTPNLPAEVITKGLLSNAQIESVVYAGQAHQQFLPNGERRGFFIGDGTGVGKGREISGIILDNMRQGHAKAVWVSANEGLMKDAGRDFSGVGGDAGLIFFQGKTKPASDITVKKGILFTTYSTLRGGEKKQATDTGSKQGKKRIDQLAKWLGEDFDGVIVFDEAHAMGNVVETKGKRGKKKASAQALAGVNLQKMLPKAKIVYVSATGATEVNNLGYASRLGLWGEGTAFAGVAEFIGKIMQGGVAAMELISRDMKALGMYISRSLSFDGVTYERLDHDLTPLQTDIYNELAKAWQIVLENVESALDITNQAHEPNAKSASLSRFWGTHQRFFNQVITSMQTPTVIEDMKKQIAAGNAVLIQLVNTNEAEQERQAARAQADGVELEELDFTPRQALMDYVRNAFPVQAYQETTDADGNTIYVPVVDAAGNPVFDQDAIKMRDQLLSNLEAIRVPENPIDAIINAFGSDKVGEVTGRGRRFVQMRDDDGNLKIVEEKRGKHAAQNDATAFQSDKKPILIFSQAGGTGFSFHADNTAKNQRKRIHYILQPGWRADAAVQGFGRSHRTNQKQPPHYVLPTTNLKAQKRFVSSIARRLDQLGALTRGQRQATSQGLFTASDNLESKYADDALEVFFQDMYRGSTPLVFSDVTRAMGLNNLIDPRTGGLSTTNLPEIPRFLNRLLSLSSTMQDEVFSEFEKRLEEIVAFAVQQGTYDNGMQTLKAESVKKVRDDVAYTDERTGAETRYVEVDVTNPIKYRTFENAENWAKSHGAKFAGWFKNAKGDVFGIADLGERVNAKGEVHRRGAVVDIRDHRLRYVDNLGDIMRGWAWGVKDGRSVKKTISTPVTAESIQAEWEKQVAEAPKHETRREHMIVGVILPVWDRVEGHPRIFRLQTDEGERMIGRIMGPKDAAKTLKNLGLGSSVSKMAPADVLAKIKSGARAILGNGWEISTSGVSGDTRIEIKVPSGYISGGEQSVLRDQGVFFERISFRERAFIPTGAEELKVFERVVKAKPVVDLFEKGAKAEGENAVESPIMGYNDPYGSLETRPGTTEDQRRTGRDAARSVERAVFGGAVDRMRGGRPTVLGLAISKDFREDGGTSFTGKQVSNPRDLALLAQVVRDPRFETVRIFYTKGDTIVGQAAFSSRLPSVVYLGEDFQKNVEDGVTRFGADGYWLVHNHPNGASLPSKTDERLTADLSDAVPGFKGHVVIDHNEYSVISRGEYNSIDVRTFTDPTLGSVNLLENPVVPNQFLGSQLSAPVAVKDMAKAMQVKDGFVVIVGVDSLNKVRVITELLDAATKPMSRGEGLRNINLLRKMRESVGIYRLFAIVPGNYQDARYSDLLNSGLFTDVVGSNGAAAERGIGNLSGGIPQSATDLKRGATPWFVEEPAYHGTPHTVEGGFSTDKIGTGEGAQAYGWGLYFASAKGVAKHYRDALSKTLAAHNTIDGKRINKRMLAELQNDQDNFVSGFFRSRAGGRAAGITSISGAIDNAIETAQENRDEFQQRLNDRIANPPIAATWSNDDYRKAIAGYEREIVGLEKLKTRIGFKTQARSGKLYSVELAPEADEYLLWDKPLSQQSEKVQEALEKAVNGTTLEKVLAGKSVDELVYWVDRFDRNNSFAEWIAEENVTSADEVRAAIIESYGDADMNEYLGNSEFSPGRLGESIYRELSSKTGNDEIASKFLHSIGIRGIKYLDGSSRRQASESWKVKSPEGMVHSFSSQKAADAYVKGREGYEITAPTAEYNFVIFDDADVEITGMESRGPEMTGYTADEIRDGLIESFGARTIRQLEANGLIKIVENAEALQALMPGIKVSKTAKAVFVGDRAYFFANRMHPASAKIELLHEIGEHYGLERLLGREGYSNLMQRVKSMRDSGQKQLDARKEGDNSPFTSEELAAGAWNFVVRNYPEEAEGSKRFMHEVLAQLGQNADIQARPWWKSVIEAVKRALVRMGFTGMIKVSDIQDMVLHSLMVAASEPEGGPRGGIRGSEIANDMMASQRGPWYYSALATTIPSMAKIADKAGMIGPKQAKDWLLARQKEGKFKDDELNWSGVMDWIDMQAEKPVFERGFGVVEEYRNEDGTWEQVDDFGYYYRTKAEAEKRMGEIMPYPVELGIESRRAVKEFPQVDLGARGGKIAVDDVLRFVRENGVEVKDVMLVTENSDVEAWWNDEGGANEETPFSELNEAEQRDAVERYQDEVGQYQEGAPKFSGSDYQLSGGENYRELLITLPEKKEPYVQIYVLDKYGKTDLSRFLEGKGQWTEQEAEARAKEIGGTVKKVEKVARRGFQSSHYPETLNIIAHVRFNERTDADGKRVLFIEEIQSDWGQAGRKEGFGVRKSKPLAAGEYMQIINAWKDELATKWADTVGGIDTARRAVDGLPHESIANQLGKQAEWAELTARNEDDFRQNHPQGKGFVPSAPFVTDTKAWTSLALKRMIAYAVDSGFDRVAWTTGEQQAERYKLSNTVDRIDVAGRTNAATGEKSRSVSLSMKDGSHIRLGVDPAGVVDNINGTLPGGKVIGKPLGDLIGKDMAEKVMAAKSGETFEGVELDVGGKGMAGYYDQIVPQVARKLGAKVGSIQLRTDSERSLVNTSPGVWEPADDAEDIVTEQPAFDITPKMREQAQQGLPLFSKAGNYLDDLKVGVANTLKNAEYAPRDKAEAPLSSPDVWFKPVLNAMGSALKGSNTFGPLDRSIHSQLHKAQKNRYFGEVFKRVQHFMADASRAALRPAELAPTVLPRIDVATNAMGALRSLLNGKAASADIDAAFNSALRGTLDDRVYATAAEADLTDDQFRIYHEIRDSVDASLDELSAAEAWGIARTLFLNAAGKLTRAGLTMKKDILESPDQAKEALIGRLTTMLEDLGLRANELTSLAREAAPFIGSTEDPRNDLKIALQSGIGSQAQNAAIARALEAFTEIAAVKDTIDKTSKVFERRDQLQKEGYVPLMRFGQHYLTITRVDPMTGEAELDEHGDKVTEYFSLFESASERDKAEAALREEFADANVEFDSGTMSEEEWKRYKGVSPESVALFAGKLGIGTDDVFQEWYRLAASNRSTLKRLIHRKGTPGFSEDGSRVMAAFLTSNGRRASMLYHMADVQEAIEGFPRQQGAEKDEAIKLVEYIQNPEEEASAPRALMFMHFLGGSISNFFINASQPAMVTLPYISQFVGMPRAMALLKEAYSLRGHPEAMSQELRDALAKADQEGKVGAQEIHHLWQETARPLISKMGRFGEGAVYRANAFMQLWGMPFAVAELMNRQVTFISAYNAAKEQGGTPVQAYSKAILAVDETQFIYGKQNRPNWARGTLGSLIFTFKLFSISYTELLVRMLRGSPESRKAGLYMLGMLFMAAGAQGMPGADDLDDLIDTIAQMLGYNVSSKLSKRKFVENLAGKEVSEFFMHGLSALSPLDVSGRMGLGNLLPGTGLLKPSNTRKESDLLEIIGPIGGLSMSYINTSDAVSTGNWNRAFTEWMPKALKDLARGAEMAVSGEARDGHGNKITDINPLEAFVKSIGFNPQSIAAIGRNTRDVQQTITFARRNENIIAEKWARGIVEGNQGDIQAARNAVVEWNATNPDTPIDVKYSAVARRVAAMRSTKEERFVKAATKGMREYAKESLE